MFSWLIGRLPWLSYWKVLACVFCLGVSSGVYLHTVWLGYLENKADKKHNEWYQKNSEGLEAKRVATKNNEREVTYAQKHLDNDCFVTADRLRVVNAALTNDTSQLK